MKLHELISSTAAHDIERACAEIDPTHAAEYPPLLVHLQTITPVSDGLWTVVIALVRSPFDDPDRDPWIDVSGCKFGSSERYAIEWTSWREWLGMEVTVENLDLTPAQMVAHCLDEMTTCGFDEDSITEVREQIMDQVGEITAQLDENR
jgi:hypothetical protein